MTSFKSVLGNLLGVLPRNITMVTDGVNKNLRVVADDTDLFARFSPSSLHSKDELENEVDLLNALNAAGAPCCEPVRADGRFVLGPFNIEGVEYHLFLNKTIVGDVLGPHLADARAFGRSLATIHQTSVNKFNASAVSRGPIVQVPRVISPVFQELKRLVAAQDHRNGDGPIGICHGDAWLGNAKWSEGRALLFDFEYARIGPVAYDIATFIWALQGVQDSDLQAAVYQSFVQGYRSVYDVLFDEEALKTNLLLREIRNIEFMSAHIAMSRDVEAAVGEFAKATCALVMGSGFATFKWH